MVLKVVKKKTQKTEKMLIPGEVKCKAFVYKAIGPVFPVNEVAVDLWSNTIAME